MAIPGLDTYGAGSGSPPYAESRWKAILRNAAMGIGNGFGAGLGAVPPGANFGTAFLASAGASSRAASAAQQAAQEYAMKQQQMQDEKAYRDFQMQDIQSQIEARAKNKTPTKEADFRHLVDDLHMDPTEARQIVYGLTAKEQVSQKISTREPKEPKTPEDISWIDNLIQETRTGNKYINGSELHGKDLSAALRQGAKLGIPVVGSADVSQINDIESARGNIEGIRSDLSSLIPKGAAGRLVAYPGIRLSTLLQTNAQRAAFATWRGSAIRNFRAVAGSKGLRLNQKEIDLAVKNDIPQLTDSYEVANQKLDNIIKQLDNAEGPIIGKKQVKPSGNQPSKPRWVYDPATDKMVPAK